MRTQLMGCGPAAQLAFNVSVLAAGTVSSAVRPGSAHHLLPPATTTGSLNDTLRPKQEERPPLVPHTGPETRGEKVE